MDTPDQLERGTDKDGWLSRGGRVGHVVVMGGHRSLTKPAKILERALFPRLHDPSLAVGARFCFWRFTEGGGASVHSSESFETKYLGPRLPKR